MPLKSSDAVRSDVTFSLSTLRHNGKPTPVIEVDGSYYPLAAVAPKLLQPEPSRGLMNLFGDWAKSEAALAALADRLRTTKSGALPAPAIGDFMAPLLYPNKLVLGGINYYDHVHKDSKMPDFKKENAIPVFFLKAPTTTLVGAGKSVRYPSRSQKFDWEIELAVIIGKTARRVPVESALDYVAGYAVGLDLSARDLQFHPKHPFKVDLLGGKTFDDSNPLGPKIVPARHVGNASDLALRLWVNGDLKQDGRTNDMIWSIAEEISAVSEHLTLEPGDVLLTGTPAGCGLATDTWLKVGDRIDAEIDKLGRLTVEIVEDGPVKPLT
jgi:2-keto-4-pentenoate hydratase/2-oxohepta-3-ene-1,7-dioic acid hydratase in catechol pathway